MSSFIIRFVFATILIDFCHGSGTSPETSKTNHSDMSSSIEAHENITFAASFGVPLVGVPHDIPSTSLLNQLQNIWFSVASAMSVALLIIIYSYLRNIGLVNECVMLHLYKDVVAIFIFMRIAQITKGIVGSFTLTKSTDQKTMNQISAQILSFTLFASTFAILTLLNIISAIRLYIAKKMVLDPPIPWDKDEKFGIKMIRLVVGVVSFGCPLILFLFEVYPRIYFDFVNQPHPKSSLLFTGPCIIQVIVLLTIMLAEKCYKKNEDQLTSTIIPYQVNYFLLCNIMMYGYILFELSAQLLHPDTRWTIFQILISILGLTTPIIGIMRSEKLATYSFKFLKERYEDAFIFSIFSVPILLSLCMYCSLSFLYWIYDVVRL